MQTPQVKISYYFGCCACYEKVFFSVWPKLCGFVASSPQILEYFLGTITCLLAKRKKKIGGEKSFTFTYIHSNYRLSVLVHIVWSHSIIDPITLCIYCGIENSWRITLSCSTQCVNFITKLCFEFSDAHDILFRKVFFLKAAWIYYHLVWFFTIIWWYSYFLLDINDSIQL